MPTATAFDSNMSESKLQFSCSTSYCYRYSPWGDKHTQPTQCSVHYLFAIAGRIASNLNLEMGPDGTSYRRRDVQPRQLIHRRVQRFPLERFLVPPPVGASRGSRRAVRFLHCTVLLRDTTGFTAGGICTNVMLRQQCYGSFENNRLWKPGRRSVRTTTSQTAANYM